jgi:hypothetical protein
VGTLRAWLVRVLGIVALLAVGVAVGRFLTPPKVVTRTETVEVVKEVVRVEVREVKIKDFTLAARTHTRRVVETRPDGTRTATTERTTSTDTGTTERTASETGVSTETSRSNSTVATKTVEARSSLRTGVLAGVVLTPAAKLTPVFGASVDGRIAGPFWLGAWGMSNARDTHALGLTFALEF